MTALDASGISSADVVANAAAVATNATMTAAPVAKPTSLAKYSSLSSRSYTTAPLSLSTSKPKSLVLLVVLVFVQAAIPLLDFALTIRSGNPYNTLINA